MVFPYTDRSEPTSEEAPLATGFSRWQTTNGKPAESRLAAERSGGFVAQARRAHGFPASGIHR